MQPTIVVLALYETNVDKPNHTKMPSVESIQNEAQILCLTVHPEFRLSITKEEGRQLVQCKDR